MLCFRAHLGGTPVWHTSFDLIGMPSHRLLHRWSSPRSFIFPVVLYASLVTHALFDSFYRSFIGRGSPYR